jgi:hypothetical protein
VSLLSTDNKAKCGGRLGIHTKQREVVRGSAKWSEVFAKRLEEVRRCALAIGGSGGILVNDMRCQQGGGNNVGQ